MRFVSAEENLVFTSLSGVFVSARKIPFPVSAQPVDATQALNLSAGVSNVKVLRGRSLS
jgi:hypothetical protein